MARSVAEGGNPHDDFGKHVLDPEELNKLRKFKHIWQEAEILAPGLVRLYGYRK